MVNAREPGPRDEPRPRAVDLISFRQAPAPLGGPLAEAAGHSSGDTPISFCHAPNEPRSLAQGIPGSAPGRRRKADGAGSEDEATDPE